MTTERLMLRLVVAAAVVLVMAGCSPSAAPADAKKLAEVLTGDAKGSAASNPVCKLFSAAEASAYAGIKLAAGDNAAMGTGCQWANADGDGMTMVQVVPMKYADSPSGAPGFRELPNLGKRAYVAKDMGGWVSGAPQGEEFVIVVVAGPKASEQTAIALMDETLKRRQPR